MPKRDKSIILKTGKYKIEDISAIFSEEKSEETKECENRFFLSKTILMNLLKCGMLDIDFLIAEFISLENTEISTNPIGDVIERLDDYEEPIRFNILIEELYRFVIQFINETFNISLEEDKHYEINANFLDSHLHLLEGWEIYFEEKLKKKDLKMIRYLVEKFN